MSDIIKYDGEIEKLNLKITILEQKLKFLQNGKNKNKGVLVHTNGKQYLVYPEKIMYIIAASNYSYIYLSSGIKLFTSKTLKNWITTFQCENIIRIHRGFCVNESFIQNINKCNKTIELLNGTILPYSRNFTVKTYFN